MIDVAARVHAEAAQAWRPPPRLSTTDWAESYRVLSPENCAIPGPYRIAVTPFLHDILEAWTDPSIDMVVCQKSAQVGWTDGVVNNCLGYIVHMDPGPVLLMFPTDNMAQRYSKEKLAPMVRDCKPLADRISLSRSREKSNTILSKNFPGGHLELVGSNSPAKLSSSPMRYFIVEEPDRCAESAGREGRPFKLGFERTKTYHNRKVMLGGSPTIKGESEIETTMATTDQRRFYIPCPHCNYFQVPTWAQVKWDKDETKEEHEVYGHYLPETARLVCVNCQQDISNAQKNAALSRGAWKPTAAFTGRAGFYLNELVSPFTNATLADVVSKFLEARAEQKAGKIQSMITWSNTSMGETWEDRGDGLGDIDLFSRLENYDDRTLPAGALFATAAVDVQDDRLEIEFVAWGLGWESWSADYVVLEGDPERETVWKDLDAQLGRSFYADALPLRVSRCLVDHGAHSRAVERYVLPRQRAGVFACRGHQGYGAGLIKKVTYKTIGRQRLALFIIGTDAAKTMVYHRLKVDEPGPGYCHFPSHYDRRYFEQLQSEKRVTRYVKGVRKKVWRLIGYQTRNEALDCRVYNTAAAEILNPKFDEIVLWNERRRKALADGQVPQKAPDSVPIGALDRAQIKRPARKPYNYARQTNWAKRY